MPDTTNSKTADLETRLTDDPEGVELDRLMQILRAFEQELDREIKRGCTTEEYKQNNVVLNGARIAQAVLTDYHSQLNNS